MYRGAKIQIISDEKQYKSQIHEFICMKKCRLNDDTSLIAKTLRTTVICGLISASR